MTMDDYAAHGPAWVLYWMYWMGFINFASILFVWKYVEARWVLAAMISSMLLMQLVLFPNFGYVRLLGLSHVLFWTPLAIYLIRRGALKGGKRLYDRYLSVLLVTILISLAFDYTDVARYLLGEREPVVILPEAASDGAIGE